MHSISYKRHLEEGQGEFSFVTDAAVILLSLFNHDVDMFVFLLTLRLLRTGAHPCNIILFQMANTDLSVVQRLASSSPVLF